MPLFSPLKKVVRWVSAEWMLDKVSNGGALVILRALSTSLAIYVALVSATHSWGPFPNECSALGWIGVAVTGWLGSAMKGLKLLGAIFAGTYAALYARFASQWTYLANLHNRILETEARNARDATIPAFQTAIARWKASFLEDAEELSLATKPIFATVIMRWGTDPGVCEEYVSRSPDKRHRMRRRERLQRLVDRVHASLGPGSNAPLVCEQDEAHRSEEPKQPLEATEVATTGEER